MDPTRDTLPSGPIDLSDEDVAEFQRLIKEETGADLSAGEARLRADELIRLVRLLVLPQKSASNEAGAAKRTDTTSTEPPRIVRNLEDFAQSLTLLRPRTKDWAWSVRAAHTLLIETFSARIMLANLDHPERTLGYDPLLEPLPRLLKDLERFVHRDIPDYTPRVVDQLHKLNRELNWITVGAWSVLDDQLPRVFLDLVGIVKSLALPTTEGRGLVPPEHRKHIEETLADVERRLFLLQGEQAKRTAERIEEE